MIKKFLPKWFWDSTRGETIVNTTTINLIWWASEEANGLTIPRLNTTRCTTPITMVPMEIRITLYNTNQFIIKKGKKESETVSSHVINWTLLNSHLAVTTVSRCEDTIFNWNGGIGSDVFVDYVIEIVFGVHVHASAEEGWLVHGRLFFCSLTGKNRIQSCSCGWLHHL